MLVAIIALALAIAVWIARKYWLRNAAPQATMWLLLACAGVFIATAILQPTGRRFSTLMALLALALAFKGFSAWRTNTSATDN